MRNGVKKAYGPHSKMEISTCFSPSGLEFDSYFWLSKGKIDVAKRLIDSTLHLKWTVDGRVGSIAQWLANLLPDKASLGFNQSSGVFFPKKSSMLLS